MSPGRPAAEAPIEPDRGGKPAGPGESGRGAEGLLRPLVLRAALRFWMSHDVDLWVNQRLLVTHVRRTLRRADKDTIRSVLFDMTRQGILIEQSLAPRRKVYRLAPRFADPTAPGYARELDDLLIEPINWATADGRFFRLGRGPGGTPHPVAAFPHHFARHAWMRTWIHAFQRGLLSSPRAGLAVVERVALRAPLQLLWELWGARDLPGPLGSAGRGFGATSLWRTTRTFMARGAEESSWNPLLSDAFRVLHDLCGHQYLRPVLGRRLVATPEPPLEPHVVYRGIDACAERLLDGKATAGSLEPPGPLRDGACSLECHDPAVRSLADRIRDLEPVLRDSLVERRWGWPGGLPGVSGPSAAPAEDGV